MFAVHARQKLGESERQQQVDDQVETVDKRHVLHDDQQEAAQTDVGHHQQEADNDRHLKTARWPAIDNLFGHFTSYHQSLNSNINPVTTLWYSPYIYIMK